MVGTQFPLDGAGLLESRRLEGAGPEASEDRELPPGLGSQGLEQGAPAPPSRRAEASQEGVPSSGADVLRGCDEAGAGSVGMDCRPGERSRSLPSPPASGGSPSSASSCQNPLAAGRKRRNRGLPGPSPSVMGCSRERWH